MNLRGKDAWEQAALALAAGDRAALGTVLPRLPAAAAQAIAAAAERSIRPLRNAAAVPAGVEWIGDNRFAAIFARERATVRWSLPGRELVTGCYLANAVFSSCGKERMRKIIHIDMDAFFASIEQRDRPGLRGLPVIVGGSAERRGVVSTCSYEARAFGVHSAMPMRTAQRLCPQAVYLEVDMKKYRNESARIREIFYSVTDLVEPVSIRLTARQY